MTQTYDGGVSQTDNGGVSHTGLEAIRQGGVTLSFRGNQLAITESLSDDDDDEEDGTMIATWYLGEVTSFPVPVLSLCGKRFSLESVAR